MDFVLKADESREALARVAFYVSQAGRERSGVLACANVQTFVVTGHMINVQATSTNRHRDLQQ